MTRVQRGRPRIVVAVDFVELAGDFRLAYHDVTFAKDAFGESVNLICRGNNVICFIDENCR